MSFSEFHLSLHIISPLRVRRTEMLLLQVQNSPTTQPTTRVCYSGAEALIFPSTVFLVL